jgi:hypothetical protein
VTAAGHELRAFVKSLIETGKEMLEAPFDLPEQEVLQGAIQQLDPCALFLIDMIESLGLPKGMRDIALLNLGNFAACAYTIGSRGTVTKNTRAAITGIMRESKREDPINPIIKEVMERHCNSKGRTYNKVVVREVQPLLEKQGHQISDKAVRERIARLKKARS